MSTYNEELLDHIKATFALLFHTQLWYRFGLYLLPTYLTFAFNSTLLFCLLMLSLVYCRSAKLAGLLGWLIVTTCAMLFYYTPESGHFIEYLLRIPRRGDSIDELISSADAIRNIPATFSSRLFVASAVGAWVGGTAGLTIGIFGRYLLGKNPNID